MLWRDTTMRHLARRSRQDWAAAPRWGASDNVNQKFTGQERDAETALDFFHARYFSSGLERFTSPDPGNAGVDFTNPQSWNGHTYVLGNPLGLVDPSGMDAYGGGDDGGDPCFEDPFACDPGWEPFPPGRFPQPAPTPPPRVPEGTGGNPLPPEIASGRRDVGIAAGDEFAGTVRNQPT